MGVLFLCHWEKIDNGINFVAILCCMFEIISKNTDMVPHSFKVCSFTSLRVVKRQSI